MKFAANLNLKGHQFFFTHLYSYSLRRTSQPSLHMAHPTEPQLPQVVDIDAVLAEHNEPSNDQWRRVQPDDVAVEVPPVGQGHAAEPAPVQVCNVSSS